MTANEQMPARAASNSSFREMSYIAAPAARPGVFAFHAAKRFGLSHTAMGRQARSAEVSPGGHTHFQPPPAFARFPLA